MAHLKTAQLIASATSLIPIAHQVQQDPAVQKSWRDAKGDVVQAASSISKAIFETSSAWRRASNGGGDLAPLYA